MKKIYIKPMMYAETFIPNEYAAGCAPGIDETTVAPVLQQCWWYLNSSGCSNQNVNQYMFTEKQGTGCTLKLMADGSVGFASGIEIVNKDGAKDKKYPKPVNGTQYPESYRWPNGKGNYHYIPVSEFGGVVDGKPKYFVS